MGTFCISDHAEDSNCKIIGRPRLIQKYENFGFGAKHRLSPTVCHDTHPPHLDTTLAFMTPLPLFFPNTSYQLSPTFSS